MKLIRDATGRFHERPFYTAAELDIECEIVVCSFLKDLHGKAEWPIATDDLTKLLEQRVTDLDLYADLSNLGDQVEGVTDFVRGAQPRVRIASELSLRDYHTNRLRTTLTHEFGHVHFHAYLFQLDEESADLFSTANAGTALPATKRPPRSGSSQACRRETILGAREVDWMEWQAGYASGAFLMPISPLRSLVQGFARSSGLVTGIVAGSERGSELVEAVVRAFAVSRDAARVRLLKTGLLLEQAQGRSLF
jgi:hypothetical protein